MSDPQGSKTTEIECEGDSAASSQTPTNDQGPVNHDAAGEEPPVSEQPEQPDDAHLVKMPNEIILSIAEHIERQSLRSLALTSSRLHHTVRDEFYRSSDYETFRLALEAGDFATIQRCIERKAAPADAVWGREHAEREDSDQPQYFDYRPINYLMLAFEKDKMTADQCFDVLRWLVENGSDMATACTPFEYWIPGNMGKQFQFARTLRHMPHSFLRAFAVEADRAKLEGAARIICYLSAQGFNFPRNALLVDYGHMRRSRESILEFTPLMFHSQSPIAWMMRSACPPSVLEALLKQLQRQGATLTSPLEQCPESLRCAQPFISCRWAYRSRIEIIREDTLMTEFWGLVVGLHNDLLDPLIWKPVYNGEVGDIWEAKLKLLDTYQGVDDFEKRHFLSILAALRKIEVKSRAEGGLVIRRDAEACWRELSSAIPDFFAVDSEILEVDDDNNPADRVHRFSFRNSFRLQAYILQMPQMTKIHNSTTPHRCKSSSHRTQMITRRVSIKLST